MGKECHVVGVQRKATAWNHCAPPRKVTVRFRKLDGCHHAEFLKICSGLDRSGSDSDTPVLEITLLPDTPDIMPTNGV